MADYPATLAEIAVGTRYEVPGTYEVTAAEIREFAADYDPQPFHLDPEAAAESHFGGLVASGWHTAAMTMRLLVAGFLNDSGARGARGVDELRWHDPVRPGDELRLETEVLDAEPYREDLGLVECGVETYAGEDLVQSYVAEVLWARES